MNFPIYRKYSNNKSYFKIFNEGHFEEIQTLGTNYQVFQFEAKILPDRHFIQDMIDMKGGGWDEIAASEYDEFHAKCLQDYKLMK